MIYVCSDIHGEYNLFLQLLDEINFSDNDVMYICGDVIDKGEGSVKLMQFIMEKQNIITILGNHEYAFLKHYWALMQDSPNDFDGILKKLQDYFEFDGHLLDWDTVDFIESLPTYVENEQFICVHAGLLLDDDGFIIHPRESSTEELVYDRAFKEPSLIPKTLKCVFFGHTPTSYISGEHKIIKYLKEGRVGDNVLDYCKIHLDIGTWLCGKVCCLCVDNLKEYYAHK